MPYGEVASRPRSDAELGAVLRARRAARWLLPTPTNNLTWEALGDIAVTTLASLTEFEDGRRLTHELKLPQA